MNPDQGTELRSGKVIHSSSGTSSPIDSDMAQSSANDSDNNETSDISSQLSEIKENYERKINELQNEFSQLKNLLMAVISKNDENNLPSTTQSSSKPTHRVGLDTMGTNNTAKLNHTSFQNDTLEYLKLKSHYLKTSSKILLAQFLDELTRYFSSSIRKLDFC